MKIKNFFADESAITISVETILMFSISILFLGIIIQSFQGLNQKQNKVLMEEEYLTVGNGIAKQMSEVTVESMASLMAGSKTTIRSEIYMPVKIADTTYSVKLKPGKLIVESSSDPYVSVEIPLNGDIIVTENSTIYSYNEKSVLEYDSKSGSIYFVNGGVTPPPDNQNPTISFLSPPDGSTITNSTIVNVSVWDNVRVTMVKYYLNGTYECSIGSPYNWTWNTKTVPGGNYTVTAVAYDTAGNSAAASRNYTIDNGATGPPVITPLSPLSDTDFKRPKIQVQITDDLGINFSTITFKVDNVNRISNVSFANVSSRLTTLTYIPTENMPISPPNHSVDVSVSDTDNTIHQTTKNWSFAILPITDADNPSTSIVLPDSSTVLSPGSPIKVTYTAADNTSGIDNISIKVTRGDGATYFHNDTISVYPTVTHDLPPTTWTFPYLYNASMNYTYSIIVYDRGGNQGYSAVGPFTAGQGEAGQLDVNTGSVSRNGRTLSSIMIKDNVSATLPVILTGLNVSWTPLDTDQIVQVKFDNNNWWTGNVNSGTKMTFGSTYTVPTTSAANLEFKFNNAVPLGRTYTIVFYMDDTTTKTVTFTK